MNELIYKFSVLNWSRIVVIGVFISFVYYLGVFDHGDQQERNIKDMELKIVQATKRHKEAEAELANVEEFKKKVAQSEEEFRKLTMALPTEVSPTDIITTISRQASESAVTVKESLPVAGIEKSENYDKARVRFQFEGYFIDIVSMMSRLTAIKRLLAFEKIEVKRVAGTPVDRPKVMFSTTMVAFRYKTVEERKKQAAAEKK